MSGRGRSLVWGACVVPAVVAVVVVVGGCAPAETGTSGGGLVSGTVSSPAGGGVSALSQAPAPVPVSSSGVVSDSYAPAPDAVWVDGEAGSAVEVKAAAEAAMRAFSNVTVGQGLWWQELEPLLTPEYAADAEFISVDRVGIASWDRVEVVNPSKNPVFAEVIFSTNDGPWAMRLQRGGEGLAWLVADIFRSGN